MTPEESIQFFEKIKDLNERIIKCQKCGLCKNITQKVIGSGKTNPDILFVGEAPGRNEDLEGTPFCGKSGMKLKEIIDKYEIKNYSIINAVKCMPPDNRKPTNEEMDACSEYFKEQLKLFKPKKIIALGKSALYQLGLKYDTIIERVGTVKYTIYGKVLILPHPSFLLRKPEYELPEADIRKFLLE